jgi:hypothetical protein
VSSTTAFLPLLPAPCCSMTMVVFGAPQMRLMPLAYHQGCYACVACRQGFAHAVAFRGRRVATEREKQVEGDGAQYRTNGRCFQFKHDVWPGMRG